MSFATKLNGTAILHELQALRKEWRRQDFRFTLEQQQRYEVLVQLRRARVNELRENGQVWVGPSTAGQSTAGQVTEEVSA